MTTRALLFADHLALGRLVETVLQERGLDLVARDPEAARAALEAQPSPCLIVVVADGAAVPALCLAARSLPPEGRHVIFVVTSDGSPEHLRALVAVGADDWVVAEEREFDSEVLGLRIDLAVRRLAAPGGDDPLASDETFRLMVETLSEGLGVKNLDGNITYANVRLCQMLGYTREEMIGRPVTDFFNEENLARELVLAPRQLDAAASYQIELTARDGRQIPTLQSPKALYDRAGRRAGSFAVVADLTAQKQVEKELRLTQFLIDRAADAAFWADREARFFYANEAACASLEYSREELLSLRVQDILRPEDSTLFEDVGRAVRAQGPVTFETMHVTRTGRELPVEVTLNCLEWGGRELYCAFARDITERTRAEQALRESEERYHSLFEGVPIGLYRTTPEGRMLDANSALVEILGFPSREALLRFDVNALYLDPKVRHGWQRELEEEGVIRTFEAQLRRHDGNVIWARCSLHAFRDEKKRILRYEGALEDITGRREAEERLLYETLHDELTGLPNRVLFMDRLRQSMERSRREPERMTVVLFLDVDRFKIVNDSLGHLVGDELLVQVAYSLLSVLRPTDTIARMGGDEFAILLEGVRDVSGAEEVASRIHHRLAAPVHLHGHEIYLSASIGIAVHTPEYERAEDLLRDADTAMYRAKSQGPAGHVVFNRAMHQFVMARLQLETDLRRAVERGQIEVWYQPVVDLRTGAVTSLEALLRWVHPRHGVIFPDEFLSVAEETGLIVQMGRFVLEESCRMVRELQLRHPEHHDLRLSVNLSNKQFFQADLFEQVRQALDESGLDPSCLGLEITEGVIIQHAESAKTRFSRLKSLGIQLSMDDFGKGYSSLNYLHRFPMDVLKIDRSFVSRIEEGSGNLAILEAIVTLAHQLGMEVVAEGIQTAAQVKKIRALGCEYGQGFLFSKPLPAGEIEGLLAPAEPVAAGSSAREFMTRE